MERVDDLQCGGLRLIQDTSLFCFSMDAVLLADFARIPAGARVVDLGAGNGILEVLLSSRQPDAWYQALEIQKPLYELLERNIHLNELEHKCRTVLGDIRSAPEYFGTGNDVCICNPPFEKPADGEPRRAATHIAARKEVLISFREICRAARRCLRWKGRFCLVHRAHRLAEILCTMHEEGVEPKILRLCAQNAHAAPKTCLVMGQRGAKEGVRVLPQLVLYEDDGSETEELRRIYRRDAQSLPCCASKEKEHLKRYI